MAIEERCHGAADPTSALKSHRMAAQVSGPRIRALVTPNCVRLIRLLECPNVFVTENNVERADGAFEMLDFRSANDWRGHTTLLQQPGESDFRWRDAELAGDSSSDFDHLRVRRRVIKIDCVSIAIRAGRA